MLSRRDALHIVAALLARQTARVTPQTVCPVPETLVLDLGAGACRVRTIRIQSGAIGANISVEELLSVLGAKTGD